MLRIQAVVDWRRRAVGLLLMFLLLAGCSSVPTETYFQSSELSGIRPDIPQTESGKNSQDAADAKPVKPHPPRTLWQAIHAYVNCLRSPKSAEPDAKDTAESSGKAKEESRTNQEDGGKQPKQADQSSPTDDKPVGQKGKQDDANAKKENGDEKKEA